MNKTELVAILAAKLDTSKKQAEAGLAAFLETVQETLQNSDSIALIGFGTFGVKTRAARDGRSPATGKAIKIPAKVVPHFKPGKALKEAVNEAKSKNKKVKK